MVLVDILLNSNNEKEIKPVRTRYAPSPTGFFHIGGARTALFNYLFAKKNNGKFIFRIEDTDISRNIKEGEDSQIDNLLWMNIEIDESPRNPVDKYNNYRQSEKLALYNELVNELLANKKAYHCFCSKEKLESDRKFAKQNKITPKYNKTCLNLSETDIQNKLKNNEEFVVRLKIDQEIIFEWNDLIRGKMKVPASSLTDPIILKQNKIPMYNFAVVVDDHDMQITHVLRGEEHLSNTPYQLAIFTALYPDTKNEIMYGHLPIIINENKKKLSKRDLELKQFVEDYKNEGYIPQAIVNYLALLGWSPKSKKEIFSMNELIENFDINAISKSPAMFDVKKLQWVANQYFKTIDDDLYLKEIKNFISIKDEIINTNLDEICLLFKKQISSYSEINIMMKDLFLQENNNIKINYDEIGSNQKVFIDIANFLIEKISNISEWNENNIKKIIDEVKQNLELSGKKLFMPIRILTSRKNHGPELSKTIFLLSKNKVLKNISQYLNEKE